VQRALNRGEAYHQLRRAISNVNGDRFRGNSDEEIQIWNESARLVANAIIYFNSKVLSNLLDSFEDQAQCNVSGNSQAGLTCSLGEYQPPG
jgi:TnpA family transposase